MSEIAVSALTPHQVKIRLKVYLAEYGKLKSEQAQRIGLRDNLVYAMLVATGAVFHFSYQQKSDAIGLLALPLACFVLGRLHVANDEKSCAIGRYLRTELHQKICELVGDVGSGILQWEDSVRSAPGRCRRKTIQLISDLVAFEVPGILALVAYVDFERWSILALDSGRSVVLLLLFLTGIAVLGLLALEIKNGADIPKRNPGDELDRSR